MDVYMLCSGASCACSTGLCTQPPIVPSSKHEAIDSMDVYMLCSGASCACTVLVAGGPPATPWAGDPVGILPVWIPLSDRYAPRFRAQARELHERFWSAHPGPPELD
jgi:hypothetical protein